MEYREGSETQFLMTRIIWSRFSLSLLGFLSLLPAIKEKEMKEYTEFISGARSNSGDAETVLNFIHKKKTGIAGPL